MNDKIAIWRRKQTRHGSSSGI